MAASVLVQTRIDPDIKHRATEVLDAMGLSVSDVVRMVLTRTANEGVLPAGIAVSAEAHDAWFRAKVLEALHDSTPGISHEQAKRIFDKRKGRTAAKVA